MKGYRKCSIFVQFHCNFLQWKTHTFSGGISSELGTFELVTGRSPECLQPRTLEVLLQIQCPTLLLRQYILHLNYSELNFKVYIMYILLSAIKL